MRSSRSLGTALAALALLAVATGGNATTLRRLPFREIARRADRILVATVVGTSSRLGAAPGGHVRPFTDVDLQDISQVAGSVPTRNVVLSIIGGSAEGRSTQVPGAPVLEVGRRYVLFLKEGEPFCGLVGWTQGVFRIIADAEGVDRVMTHDGEIVADVRDGGITTGGQPMALGDFLQAVWIARSPAMVVGPAGEGK